VNTTLAVLRTIYFAAAIVLFGELAFRTWVEHAALRRLSERPADAWRALWPRSVIRAAALATALIAAVLWFLAQAEVMSGMPLAALSRDALRSALFDTGFGRVSLIRVALAVALAVVLVLARKDRRCDLMMKAGSWFAAGLLGSIAWTGHANVEQGFDHLIHVCSDLAHLIAAGAWLGALPALALIFFMVRRDPSRGAAEFAALATRRFSVVGIASVSTLAFTGLANAWYTVGTVPALIGTEYGRLLALKLLLFGAMLAFAAVNRFRYTPELVRSANSGAAASPSGTLSGLGANTVGEIALGIAVLGIVGALGVTAPGTHTQTVWPLRYTFAWEAARDHSVSIALCLAIAAASIAIAAGKRRHRLALAGGTGVAAVALSIAVSLLAVPAYPTTYFRSPIPYSAASIALGGEVYAAHCSSCHGARGHGDGPAAATLAEHPANLPEHVLHHRQGDVLWWIEHGIPGTPMPAFEGQIEPSRIWNVMHWLRVQAELESAKRMGNAVQAWAIEAPNFTFQIDHRRQESLSDQRGQYSVLLVLFDPAESLARLRALSEVQRALGESGLRVIAIPSSDEARAATGSHGIDASILASFSRPVVSAYAIFAPENSPQGNRAEPRHAEFLIDRQGYIRARWTPNHGSAWTHESYLLSQLLAMEHVKARPSVHPDHDHVH